MLGLGLGYAVQGAQRLQALLRARFKVEVRSARSLSFYLCKLQRWRYKSRARRAGESHILRRTLLRHDGHTKLYTSWNLSHVMCRAYYLGFFCYCVMVDELRCSTNFHCHFQVVFPF